MWRPQLKKRSKVPEDVTDEHLVVHEEVTRGGSVGGEAAHAPAFENWNKSGGDMFDCGMKHEPKEILQWPRKPSMTSFTRRSGISLC